MADFTKIGQQIAAADNVQLSFASIPGTYKHLLLLLVLRTTAAAIQDDGGIRFNADAATNYTYQILRASATGITASNSTAISRLVPPEIPGDSANANVFAGIQIWIPNYAATTMWKTCIIQGGYFHSATAGQNVLQMIHAMWKSTAAITDIVIDKYDFTSKLKTNSMASLYGLS